MCHADTKQFFREILRLAFAVFAVVSFLMRPEIAAKGILQGLALCYQSVIPALFPFFVLSKLILSSPLAPLLSLPLLPYTRYVLGIRDSRAATALLLGLTGGFGGGASSLQTIYTAGALSRTEGARLLWCIINAGPAFVAAGVGATMLHSTAAGWVLYAALCLGSLCSGIVGRIVEKSVHSPASNAASVATAVAVATKPLSLIDCVREAVFSVLTLCGFVLFFSFLIAVAVPPHAPDALKFWLALPLEATTACALAASSSSRAPIYLCCAALSVMGASIFLQVRTLVTPELSLRALVISRFVHLPSALLWLWLLLRIFPLPLAAAAPSPFRLSMPIDACCSVFLLCCTFICITSPDKHLRFLQKKL